MDYIELSNLIGNPLLRDIAVLALIFIGVWNLTHAKATSAAVTPNHGSSLADSIKRQEAASVERDKQIEELRNLITEHILTDTPEGNPAQQGAEIGTAYVKIKPTYQAEIDLN